MNTEQSFNPNEGDLRQIKASELKPGNVFYWKNDKGEFETCVVDLNWYPTKKMMEQYRAWCKKQSEEGRLYFRRDKPGFSFRGWDTVKEV